MTDAELAWVRARVGPAPTDEAILEVWERVGTPEATVVELLETRLAALLAAPASVAVPGEISVNFGENIRALRAALDQARLLLPGDTGAGARVIPPPDPVPR